MSTTVERDPSPQIRRASKNIDENGVPTIASSVPLALIGLGLFFAVPTAGFLLFRTFGMAVTGEASEGGEIWELPGDYRRMLWVTGTLRTLAFGWMCLAAYNFFSRRSAAPRMLLQMFAGGIALNLLEGWWEASFADGDEAYRAEVVGQALRGILVVHLDRLFEAIAGRAQRVRVSAAGEVGASGDCGDCGWRADAARANVKRSRGERTGLNGRGLHRGLHGSLDVARAERLLRRNVYAAAF